MPQIGQHAGIAVDVGQEYWRQRGKAVHLHSEEFQDDVHRRTWSFLQESCHLLILLIVPHLDALQQDIFFVGIDFVERTLRDAQQTSYVVHLHRAYARLQKFVDGHFEDAALQFFPIFCQSISSLHFNLVYDIAKVLKNIDIAPIGTYKRL